MLHDHKDLYKFNVDWLLLLIPFLAPTGAWGIHETFRFTLVS
jgi:hypothetical protein